MTPDGKRNMGAGDMTGTTATTGDGNSIESTARVSSGNTVAVNLSDSLQAIFYELGKIGNALSLLATRTDDRLRALENSVETLGHMSRDRGEKIDNLESRLNLTWIAITFLAGLVMIAIILYWSLR